MLVKKVYKSDDGKQEATIFLPSHFKKIAVHVSSGKDSAMVLFMLCEYLMENNRTDVEIVAAHVIAKKEMPFSKPDFDKVIDEFEKEYPKLKFSRDYVDYVSNPNYPKVIETRKQMVKLIKEQGVQAVFGGRTRPPSEEILEKIKTENNFDEVPDAVVARKEENVDDLQVLKTLDDKFEVTNDVENCSYMFNNPILPTDTFFVYEMYKRSKFMSDVIFPLTRSCVGNSRTSHYWTHPCTCCWWCCEKKLVFGAYDGEQIK